MKATRLAAAIGVGAIVVGVGVTVATARISSNTFGDTVTISRNGLNADATLIFGCTEGERYRVVVTLTQRSTAAWARTGRIAGACTGDEQRIPVRLEARGDHRFAEGTGEICGLARTILDDTRTDVHQWCRAGGVTIQQ